MNKLTFNELTELFGKQEVTSIIEAKLLEEELNYKWLRANYERKKAYLEARALDKKTPKTRTYFGLKSQLLDIEELPKLDKSAKRLNRFAFQYLQLTGNLSHHSDKFLDEMKLDQLRQVPIETVYEGHLRAIGSRLIGKCPFHEERTASFTIYTDTNSFYCFGCNKGGGNIDFLMQRDNLTFSEALRRLQ